MAPMVAARLNPHISRLPKGICPCLKQEKL
jgi:hypothetical protein